MPRKRGHEEGKEGGRNGAKTDEGAASRTRRQPQKAAKAKQRESELAKKTPYGGDRDRRRTS